ncbi:MAG: hypothetical protein GY870_15250 [archaeon]|nr:hypothetical protein [archaeon]
MNKGSRNINDENRNGKNNIRKPDFLLKKQNLILIILLIGGIASIGGVSYILGQETFDYQISECEDSINKYSESFQIQILGSKIYFEHNLSFNCGLIVNKSTLYCSIVGDIITIKEKIYYDELFRCVCLYKINGSITVANSGTYTIVILLEDNFSDNVLEKNRTTVIIT